MLHTMKTRSQTRKPLFEVNIDFDEASRYWNANKKRTGDGTYKYVCGNPLKNGKFCKRNTKSGNDACSLHVDKLLDKINSK
jgi:hypothetical protein